MLHMIHVDFMNGIGAIDLEQKKCDLKSELGWNCSGHVTTPLKNEKTAFVNREQA